jgi:threonine/homoserine efflux transporter RhtA
LHIIEQCKPHLDEARAPARLYLNLMLALLPASATVIGRLVLRQLSATAELASIAPVIASVALRRLADV